MLKSAWHRALLCSRQEDGPVAVGLLPRPCVTHLPGLPLWGLGRPPSDETQTTRWPPSHSHCLQLCHGRPVCLHVLWGVFVLIFDRGTKSIMSLSIFSLCCCCVLFLCHDISGCIGGVLCHWVIVWIWMFNSSWSHPGSQTIATSVSL